MKKYGKITLVVLIFLIGIMNGTVKAADWPCWRGPNGDGISMEKNWNPSALNANVNILWRSNVGMGHSAVSIQGNRLFTLGENMITSNQDTTYEDVIYSLDVNTGNELWRYTYPIRRQPFPGPGSTPTLDGNRVYTTGRGGELYCFDANSGMVLWRKNIITDFEVQNNNWGYCASPLIAGDLMILNGGQAGIALNKNTGKVVWKSESGGCGLSTPVLFEDQGKQWAAITANGSMQVVNIQNGDVQWNHTWRTDADPISLQSRLLLVGGGRALGSKHLKMEQEPVVLWENNSFSGVFQTGVIIDGYAYGLCRLRRGNTLQCVELSTGEQKWSHEMKDWGSLMAADGKLIILDGEGELIIAEANPEEYRQLSSARVLPQNNWQTYDRNTPKCCWTAPVLANGKIYARNTWGELVCVDVSQ
jgi:outer membrane protein assembly factor BamB